MPRLQCAGVDRADQIGLSRRRTDRSSLALHELQPRMDDVIEGVIMIENMQLEATVTHRYETGQKVRLSRGFPYRNAASGDYNVLHKLPSRDGEFQYRIKSSAEPYERVVRESELESASAI